MKNNRDNQIESIHLFTIGQQGDRDVVLTPQAKKHHTIFYGSPLDGKQMHFLACAEEEAKQPNGGATFILESSNLGGFLTGIAKEYKKNVIWLNPRLNLQIQEHLLFMETYNENFMNDFILDYKKYLRLGYWVIIDLEPTLYSSYSHRATKLLLQHLKKSILTIGNQKTQQHTLFVENSIPYLSSLEFFIKEGYMHNISLMVWQDSPQQFQTDLVTIETYFRNVVIQSFHAKEDEPYFATLFSKANLMELFPKQGNKHSFFKILTDEIRMTEGGCRSLTFDEEKLLTYNKGITLRKNKLLKTIYEEIAKREVYFEATQQLKENKNLTEEQRSHYQHIKMNFVNHTFLEPNPHSISLKELEERLSHEKI